jgi:hypothetical protein
MGAFDRRPLAGSSCVLLTRDLRATLASAYHQAVHRVKVFHGSPSAFLRSERYGVIKLVSFYNLWEELRPQFGRELTVRYEAMLDDPIEPLVSILNAFGVRIDRPLVELIVEDASFENMKRLSTTPEYAGTVLAPNDPSDPNTYKVRVGGRSRYTELFTDEDLSYVDRVVADLLLPAAAERLGLGTAVPAIVGV